MLDPTRLTDWRNCLSATSDEFYRSCQNTNNELRRIEEYLCEMNHFVESASRKLSNAMHFDKKPSGETVAMENDCVTNKRHSGKTLHSILDSHFPLSLSTFESTSFPAPPSKPSILSAKHLEVLKHDDGDNDDVAQIMGQGSTEASLERSLRNDISGSFEDVEMHMSQVTQASQNINNSMDMSSPLLEDNSTVQKKTSQETATTAFEIVKNKSASGVHELSPSSPQTSERAKPRKPEVHVAKTIVRARAIIGSASRIKQRFLVEKSNTK